MRQLRTQFVGGRFQGRNCLAELAELSAFRTPEKRGRHFGCGGISMVKDNSNNPQESRREKDWAGGDEHRRIQQRKLLPRVKRAPNCSSHDLVCQGRRRGLLLPLEKRWS